MRRVNMRNKNIFAVLAAVTFITLFFASQVFSAEPIRWKAQTLWAATETPHKIFEELCAKIKVMTQGRLEIQAFPAGAIIPTNEALDALKNNVIQAMHEWPGYYSGKNPAFAAIGDLTMAWEHPWEADAFFHYGGGLDLLRELYAPFGAYTVGVMWWGVESYPSKKPIRNMHDFKGIKIRVPQGMEAELLTNLGASVVVLPGGEVYSALDKGVVDATNWSTVSQNNKLGYHKIAPYFTYPGFHSMPVGDFTVNMKEWNKLPDDVKQILRTATREWCWENVERIALEDIQVAKEAKDKGATPVTWTKEAIFEIRAEAKKVWESWKAKSPQTKKVIEAQEDFLRKIGKIN
jgi:TRAP-type mannitol/chloroaromatic compound transport system substrate-binding protein